MRRMVRASFRSTLAGSALNELGHHLEATSKGILCLQLTSFEAPLWILSSKSLNGMLLSDSRQVGLGGGAQT